MDLASLLRSTIVAELRQHAEGELEQIRKTIGFAPSLLQVVMRADCDMPVRHAGSIYLKNLISSNWQDREAVDGQETPFALYEQDKAFIRDNIIEAVVHAPNLIKVQLSTCVQNIVKYDFPGRWTQIVDKIIVYLSNPDTGCWHGALLCLYQLVRNFQFRKIEGPLHEAMTLLLPQLHQMEVELLPDQSELSVLLQKEGLKIFYTLTMHTLPLNLISKNSFAQWMEVLTQIVKRPVPPAALLPGEDERSDLAWWKCKKWALRTLYITYERYGSPGLVPEEYSEFAEWYINTFSSGSLEALLSMLDSYRSGQWVSPRVLQECLMYINQAVSHAFTWRIVKPHMQFITQDVLFPLMCYSAEDHELWTVDPHEYIRLKFDTEGIDNPVTAAQNLLYSLCRIRKKMLQKTLNFITQVLTNPATEPSQRDGALQMAGTLAELLLKDKPKYRNHLDQLFLKCILPEFNSDRGHMRARACWLLHNFANDSFKQEQVLMEAVNSLCRALISDKELPVKVQAAIALQSMLNYQKRAHKYVEPQVEQVVSELLVIIRETENDDLSQVMQKLVEVFTPQLVIIAVQISEHLVATFKQVVETEERLDDMAVTGMRLLSTIETLLTVMKDQPGILELLEPTVLPVIAHVLQNEAQELYEEVLSLIYDLTSRSISQDMWKVFELLYQVFLKNGVDHFTDMMPALHSYVTIDTDAFLANEQRLLAIYQMCKEILTNDHEEEAQSHAAKLLEVVLLQCRKKIDLAVPMLVELAATRLLREVKTSELRTMCLLVLIAALYYDPQLLFSVLQTMPDFTNNFIKQWLQDTACFRGIHDRKLCILGLCTMISMPNKPPALIEMAPKVLPSLILLFDGLKRAYEAEALDDLEQEEEESDSSEGDMKDLELLSSDEDELVDQDIEYLDKPSIQQMPCCSTSAGFNVLPTRNEVDPELEDEEESKLDCFTTPLDDMDFDVDVYQAFKQVMEAIQNQNPEWYAALTANLTEEQLKSLSEICVLAEQRAAARESQRIKQQGGYTFPHQAVPSAFKFGDS